MILTFVSVARSPTGFESVSEYYSYISQKLRSEGVDIDCIVPKLVKRLGVEHPLMDALDKCVEIDPSRYFVNGASSTRLLAMASGLYMVFCPVLAVLYINWKMFCLACLITNMF